MASPETVPERGAKSGFDARDFRDAMGQFASGVVVISTGKGDAIHAMTANAFMSGSLDPVLVLVSVARTAKMHDRLAEAGHYGISVLAQSQMWVSNHFAGKPAPQRSPEFEELDGTPVIARATVRLAADLRHAYECGDHTLYVGEVRALEIDRTQDKPLLYYAGRYRHVAAPDWSEDTMPQILFQDHEFSY